MADYSDMKEQAKRTAKSRDRSLSAADEKMLESQQRFYEAMAESEAVAMDAAQGRDRRTETSRAA